MTDSTGPNTSSRGQPHVRPNAIDNAGSEQKTLAGQIERPAVERHFGPLAARDVKIARHAIPMRGVDQRAHVDFGGRRRWLQPSCFVRRGTSPSTTSSAMPPNRHREAARHAALAGAAERRGLNCLDGLLQRRRRA